MRETTPQYVIFGANISKTFEKEKFLSKKICRMFK